MMSNAVQFLESLGRSPHPLSDEELVVAAANLDVAVRDALAGGDVAELSRLLGGRANMACVIFAAEDDESEEHIATDRGQLRNCA